MGALFVNQTKLILLCVAMFICLSILQFPNLFAQTVAPKLTIARPIYPIWKIGGKINITATGLVTNVTYNVWLQRPTDVAPHNIGTQFRGGNGTIPFAVTVGKDDAPGTYRVSLSTSNAFDSRSAVAHFGIFGTNADSYKRTDKVLIAGGGITPASVVRINVTAVGQSIPGFPLFVTTDIAGNFNYTFKLTPSMPVGIFTISMNGTTYDDRTSSKLTATINVNPTSIDIRPTANPDSHVERTANCASVIQAYLSRRFSSDDIFHELVSRRSHEQHVTTD